MLSEMHLKPHEEVLYSELSFYHTNHFPGIKGRTAVAVRKGIPYTHTDLPPLVCVEATGVCIPIDNSKVLLAAVLKSPC
jgi:hypothetical protein